MSVVVTDITKRFAGPDAAAAVDGVSFAAPEGGVTSLLGPSGSGKSTLLRLIAGLEIPDEGRVLVRGRDVTDVSVRERNVGFVFQGYSLFDSMNVRDNVGFGLGIRRAPRREIRARVRELLQLVQLEGYEERMPHQLSGGQRQRVALARALATRPSVLLLDEPFGALDTRIRAELRRWLRDLHEVTHVTTVLVTHDQEEALELSDHLVVLEAGRVAQAGTPSELYDAPSSPFVASFLGGASVLQGVTAGGRVAVGELSLPAPSFPSGARVRVFVRPESVRLSRGCPGKSRVLRLVRVGAQAKLDLELEAAQRLSAIVPWEQVVGLTVGDPVRVDVNAARVFPS